MRRISWLVAPIAVSSLVAGIAVAGTQSSETTPVTGDFEATLVKQKQRTCDSSNSEFRLRFEGSQTSSDPRLTGDLEAEVRSVVNTQTGWGRTSGTVTVREPGGGPRKFRSRVVGVLEPDGGSEGFIYGRSVARPHVTLLANFNVQQDPQTLVITGEFGKDTQTSSSQDPAIITDACSGGREKHASDDGQRSDHEEHHGDDEHRGSGRHDRDDH
jgi:hypothetical protein